MFDDAQQEVWKLMAQDSIVHLKHKKELWTQVMWDQQTTQFP